MAAVAAMSLIVAACTTGSDDRAGEESPGEGADPAIAGTRQVTIIADEYQFTNAPSELEAGVIDLVFENIGTVEHEIALVEIGETEIEQVGADLAVTLEGGPFPSYLQNLAIPLVADGGETLRTTTLVAEGNYALICTLTGSPPETASTGTLLDGVGSEEVGQPHYMLGMVQALTVVGGDESLALPETGSTITARDYTFDVDVSAGRQTVAFANEGPDQVHHGVIFAFKEGVDEAAAEGILDVFLSSAESEETPPPPELDLEATEEFGDFGIFSTGLGATYEVEFESGRTYAVVCFIQDRSGGPPHALSNDMQEVFTVQ